MLCQLHSASNAKGWIISLFVPADQQEILVQDVIPLDEIISSADQLLIGVRLPFYYILDQAARINSRVWTSLASLNEHSDKASRDALLSFSCHLRCGRVEQAYQVVRSLARFI